MMEIQIPFDGFYGSIHEDEVNRELESVYDSWSDAMPCDIPESLSDLFFDAAQWGNAYREYAKEYAESFIAEYLKDGTFVEMTSPREYNFATDRVFIDVSRDAVADMVRKTDRAILDRVTKERFTSCDGFISNYRNDWRHWGRLSEWDHNQLGTLLIAYLETERGETWDQWAEYSLCEDISCNGLIHNALWQGDKATRAWRIFNYLTDDRANRAVKTMAQWCIAFAKPWESTPLGSVAK
ncbi:hypothetical protein QO034_13320 [Sedimentitalea sp. JM2-8]|uniref:Uncharacterized protein n=1 Tax=Sedimentitalea xiamensis TaxID=3050037 RepID=A0ABT7FG27_9RHOB|nr:hypothetical protein [Sedimentitalea xiamensis]MDK3074096.1 hypothetical protein [Sedimentitalea xiamensis]